MIRTPQWKKQSDWFSCRFCDKQFSTSLLLKHHQESCEGAAPTAIWKTDRFQNSSSSGHVSRTYKLQHKLKYPVSYGGMFEWWSGLSAATGEHVTVKLENKVAKLGCGHKPTLVTGSGWLQHEADMFTALGERAGIPKLIWMDTKSSATQAHIGLFPLFGWVCLCVRALICMCLCFFGAGSACVGA